MAVRPVLALVGPTASGKTEAAIELAGPLGAEIVSVDSMLVYRGMDVGTAKPTPGQRARVPHHMLDLVEPSEPFSVGRYQHVGLEVIDDIRSRDRSALLVGGSGLYYRALVDDLELPGTDPGTRSELERDAAALGAERIHRRLAGTDPAAAAKIEPGNVRRTVRALEVAAITGERFSSFAEAWGRYPAERVRAAGIAVPRDVLSARVEARLVAMLEGGWLDEVRGLVDRGFGGWLTATQAIGYAELARHLEGRLALEEAWESAVKRTKNLARRQMAWFRRDPRIRWFDAGSGGASDVIDDVRAYLEGA